MGEFGNSGSKTVCLVKIGAEAAQEDGQELRRRRIEIDLAALVLDGKRGECPSWHDAQSRPSIRD